MLNSLSRPLGVGSSNVQSVASKTGPKPNFWVTSDKRTRTSTSTVRFVRMTLHVNRAHRKLAREQRFKRHDVRTGRPTSLPAKPVPLASLSNHDPSWPRQHSRPHVVRNFSESSHGNDLGGPQTAISRQARIGHPGSFESQLAKWSPSVTFYLRLGG